MILFPCLGALKAVSEKTSESNDVETINELALAGIKNVVEKQEVAADLHSAVYIFHLVQALIRHVSVADAYKEHVGKIEFLLFEMNYSNDSLQLSVFGRPVPLCKTFLSRKWYSFDGREMHGAEFNSLIEQLLKGYFKDAKFGFVRSNLQWMTVELAGVLSKGGLLVTFPCIKL